MKKTALAITFLLAACSGSADQTTPASSLDGEAVIVQVILTEFAVELDRDAVPVGVPVIFRVSNQGSIDHNLVLEGTGAVDDPLLDRSGKQAKIMNLKPGGTAELLFTFEEGADYGSALQLGCHLPGHYEAGMFQNLTVGN